MCALFHNSIVAVSLDKSRPTTNFHQLPDGKIIQYHPPLRIFIFCLLCYISVFLPPSPSQDFRVKKGGKRIRPNPEPVDFTGVSRFVLIISYGHSFAVVSLESGDDIKTVQANLGHATVSFTLDVYGHVSQNMRRQSAERMNKFIQSVTA